MEGRAFVGHHLDVVEAMAYSESVLGSQDCLVRWQNCCGFVKKK